MDPRVHSSVMVMADEVIKMVKITLDPNSTLSERHEAYQLHEDFKSNSPRCAEVGFYMFDTDQGFELPLRLCGLQFVQCFVQSNWDSVDAAWRDDMKVKAMKLIELADFKEDNCLKEAVVKVIVEVIKRSWPQLWPSLFEDLSNLQEKGDAQLELVLIVLMRLSEDLNGLDEKVKQQRRKDMTTTLNKHLPDLFKFFITTIHDKTMKLKQVPGSAENIRLTSAALYTIAQYTSWVNLDVFMEESSVLFKVLFWLLEVDEVKFNAAQCLASIFERKGQAEKRVEMLNVLSSDALNIVEISARKAVIGADSGNQNEYKFLKQLAEMLVSFGRCQIASLWGEDKGIKERPKCFERYLKIMLDFSKHDSMVVLGIAMKVWHTFSFHTHIPKDQLFLSALQLLPDTFLRMMCKVTSANVTQYPGGKYRLMDFDDEDDYSTALADIRRSAVEVTKQVSIFIPHQLRQFCMEKLKQYMTIQPNTQGSLEVIIVEGNKLLWEGYMQFSKHFFNSFFDKTPKAVTPEAVQQCSEYLRLLIAYNDDTGNTMIPVLLTMDALFPMLRHSHELLKPCMQKLSSLMRLHKEGELQESWFKIKRQAIVSLTSLCKSTPELLADNFDELQLFFGEKARTNIFTNHEKRLLLQGMLHVSKCLKDTEKMKTFVNGVFSLPLIFFNRDDVKKALTDTSSFVTFLGLDAHDVHDESAISRRDELIMVIYTLEAATRALTLTKEGELGNEYPEEHDIVTFVETYPWIQHMIDILPHIFDLAKQLCLLWTMGDKFSPAYKDCLLPNSSEIKFPAKNDTAALEGEQEQDEGESHRHAFRCQIIVFSIHEALYTSLSLYGRCLGAAFFSLPGMIDVFIEKVVKSWQHLPNYRIRKVWRAIIKAFSLQCPAKYYETFLGPLLAVAIDQVHRRLTREWPRVQTMVKEKTKSQRGDDEGDESTEIIEMMIMYNLSKEVFDILAYIITFKRENYKKAVPKVADGSVEMIGKLGEFVLTHECTSLALITTLFSALTFPDSSIICRLCFIITAIGRKLFVKENPVNPEMPTQMFLRLLQGLQVHGADSAAQAGIINTALSFYLQMREQYPGLVQVMMMVPTCKEEELKSFDMQMFMGDEKLNESTKRKRFRKLLEGAIGKTVSELHKSDLKIQDLPPLVPRVRPPKLDIIADTGDAGLCQLFAPDE